jgi:hypothetical protein
MEVKIKITVINRLTIVDAPGNDGNASMSEEVKRPNPSNKMMMRMMMMMMIE